MMLEMKETIFPIRLENSSARNMITSIPTMEAMIIRKFLPIE
jgi:hypothetical protein